MLLLDYGSIIPVGDVQSPVLTFNLLNSVSSDLSGICTIVGDVGETVRCFFTIFGVYYS